MHIAVIPYSHVLEWLCPQEGHV